jgi:hypothetical protein
LVLGDLFWLSLSQKLTILDIEEISQHTTGISMQIAHVYELPLSRYRKLVIFLMEKWLNEKGIAEFHMDGT